MVPCTRLLPLLVSALAALLASRGAEARDTLTGVCPDGSIFIVQRSADIPCRNARLVEPQEVPPIKPEFLPRPYAWEVFNRQQDPNNPYNLVEAARRVREAGEVPPDVGTGSPPTPGDPPPSPQPPQTARVPSSSAPAPPVDFGFTEKEIRDLFLIVELAQRRAPATFAAEEGAPIVVRIARSAAFDARLREWRAGHLRPGRVLLFSAVAEEEVSFHPNLTFVQGHEAFQPDTSDPKRLALIHGRAGALRPQQAVLGFVVLPEHLDPSRPMDIYWNDRRLTATLTP
jgi:hypothetical protein